MILHSSHFYFVLAFEPFGATNSTVTKNVEPYSIVGGNPAKEIKKRFAKEQIEKLLEIKWWHWEIEKITKNVQNLTGENIENLKFIK